MALQAFSSLWPSLGGDGVFDPYEPTEESVKGELRAREGLNRVSFSVRFLYLTSKRQYCTVAFESMVS